MPRSELALKIAFVSRYPPVHCGVGEYTRMLASGLRTVLPSASIRVYSTGEAGWERYYDEPLGVEIIPSYMRRDPSYEGLIKNLEDDGGADVVHLQHEYGIYGDGPRIVDACWRLLRGGWHPLSWQHSTLWFISRVRRARRGWRRRGGPAGSTL
ncbi:hypothetical protein [Aeropyrum camini]|uniref:hypothetical protein n=1 Tax=Aeropyrum camini TaxID=229980 RepID=UPI00138F11EE|nr:hypothetical protein [Aeropyrum camini]